MVAEVKYDLKKAYFEHLLEIVCDRDHEKVDYIPLLDLLHSIPFTYSIEKDENRLGDGEFLRKEWLQEEDLYEYLYEFDEDRVSVLEVLIGIAKRLEFEVGNVMHGDHTNERFWELLANLDIEKYSAGNYKPLNIKEKVRKWMSRKYKKDGFGSIFPVKKCEKDMRLLQIWDQMSLYVEENWG